MPAKIYPQMLHLKYPSVEQAAGAADEPPAHWLAFHTIWDLRAGPKHAHRYQYSPLTQDYNVAHEAADT
jgi:hypothetical protein